ncbi:hypothetical protein [Acinetobacter bouvetii]|uniref:Uncharacterized protein n=1 Tax=Acinetobacter bouvetii TaxID=202951 RepID=A0A811GES6_9GAMM|nr:hypothetical protein [Acinetobacter bouvetii]CAB1214658.1 hypothetical protein SFB21_1637 [Acinetobacter bouvetii]
MIFWAILIIVVFLIFQCTQKSEANKTAPTLMYERLYQCTRELDVKQHQALIQKIQSTIQDDMKQVDLVQLINQCRNANPVKSKQDYVNAIKNLK